MPARRNCTGELFHGCFVSATKLSSKLCSRPRGRLGFQWGVTVGAAAAIGSTSISEKELAMAVVYTTMNSIVFLHKFLPTRRSSSICKFSLQPCPRIFFASSLLTSDQRDVADDTPSILRKLIWFHHIKSSKKKKHIVEWGKELRLGGYCKPGFPGVLVFEGEGENVTDYLKRIKRLRWQHLQVRGEEEEPLSSKDQSLDSLRRFPLGIRELPETGMSELAEKCREADLEALFLTALKISR